MASEGTLRRRYLGEEDGESKRIIGAISSEQEEKIKPIGSIPKHGRIRWRSIVRWIARILLVLVFFLSCVRVVDIRDTSASRTDEILPGETLLLVITNSRADYLKRCLDSVFKQHPGSGRWPIAVSHDVQDGLLHAEVISVLKNASQTAQALGIRFVVWKHDVPYTQDFPDFPEQEAAFRDMHAYRRITKHYHWALSHAFGSESGGAGRVVILEDDMEIAPDFYMYFDALTPRLERDPSIYCVSAWNDNGKPRYAFDEKQLHRTDFFPGLGWMMKRSLWEEVKDEWPKFYWDDWMRAPERTRGRQCIRPEVSRTANFGKEGASSSFHYEDHVSKVQLGTSLVNFSAMDLSYLDEEKYASLVFGRMSKAVRLRYSNYLTSRPQKADVIAFFPKDRPETIGKRTGIMTDHRHGIFRTMYRGVIIIPWNGFWAFLVDMDFKPPDGYQLGASICCD